MSGTPRRINTDRSLGTPSAGGGTGGGVPPRPPVPPQSPAPQEDDGQNFLRSDSPEAVQPEGNEAHTGGGNGGSEPPRHGGNGGRRKKRRHSPIWLPLAIVLGAIALIGCGVVYAVGYVNRVQESIRPEEGRAYSSDGTNDGMTDMILYCQFDIKNGALRMLQIPRNTLVTTENRTITLSSGKTYKASNYQINSVALSNGGSMISTNCRWTTMSPSTCRR